MKIIRTILSMAICLAAVSFSASAQGPMGGGFPGGGMPPMGGGFPGFGNFSSGGNSKQDENYQKKLEKILTPEQFQDWQSHQAARTMPAPGQMPEGFTPGQMPEGFTPGQMPEGFTPGQMPEGFTPGQRPEGFTPGQRPEGAPAGASASADSDEESDGTVLSNAELKRRATAKTDRMAKQLNLTEAQYKKVLKLNINDMRIRQNSSQMGMGGFGGGFPGGMPMF